MNLELSRMPELQGVVLDVASGERQSYWRFLRLAAGTRVMEYMVAAHRSR